MLGKKIKLEIARISAERARNLFGMNGLDALFALALFAFVSSITPGPNNLMLLSSGTNFGLRRTLPHLFGVTVGFSFLVVVIGVGLGAVFEAVPAAHAVFSAASVAYLLVLAWKIATSTTAPSASMTTTKPLGFWGAVAFQWVNPKAWTMGLTAVAAYVPKDHPAVLAVVAAVFAVVNLPCCAAWAVLGVRLRRFLSEPAKLRAFNVVAAALLLASLIPLLRG